MGMERKVGTGDEGARTTGTETTTGDTSTPDPGPGPRDSSVSESARFRRIERVTVLYAQITAATREFLRAVAACDRHEDWREEGFACCADWLAWHIGITRGTAREKIRAARALEDLPQISDAMARGEISFSKVRALTRVARPESEAELRRSRARPRRRVSSAWCAAGRRWIGRGRSAWSACRTG